MIWALLLISLTLRLVGINQSLWLDEAINVNFAKQLSFKDLVFNYSVGDFHPPLFHPILKSFILALGSSEIFVRLPSVIFGVGSVFMIYLIGKTLFEKKTGLIAATLLATSPLHIYYSQEARMYMAAAFFTSLSVYFFILLTKKDRLLYWLGFIISTSAMVYTDYLPYLMIPIYVAFILYNHKRLRKGFIWSFIPSLLIVGIALIPWLFVFVKQIKVGLSAAAASPAWSQVVGTPDLKKLAVTFVKFTIGRISNNNDFLYAIIFAPIGIYVAFLFLLSLLRLSFIRSFLWFWFFLPVFLAFILGFFIPVFSYFRLLFVLPAFYLIWASAISTVNWVAPTRVLLSIALAINLTCTAVYFLNPEFQREDWRQATKFTIENANKKSLVLFESNYSMPPFDYYNRGKVESVGGLDKFGPDETFVKNRISKVSQGKDKIFLFQYLSQISDPQGLIFEDLTKLGYKNTSTTNFNGVGFVYEFRP